MRVASGVSSSGAPISKRLDNARALDLSEAGCGVEACDGVIQSPLLLPCTLPVGMVCRCRSAVCCLLSAESRALCLSIDCSWSSNSNDESENSPDPIYRRAITRDCQTGAATFETSMEQHGLACHPDFQAVGSNLR